MSKPHKPAAAAPAAAHSAAAADSASAPTEPDDLITRVIGYVCDLHPNLKDQAAEVDAALRAEFGGTRWYVPNRKPETDRARLASQVLEIFNGRNATEVARKLRISRATVYRVLKQPGRA